MTASTRLLTIGNQCRRDLVAQPYAPILDAAVREYTSTLGDDVLDIRLMGSVPRGRALLYRSDIDFAAISRHVPSPEVSKELEEGAARILLRAPVVSRVDLEVELAESVHPAREFVFRTDSISIYGTDLYPERAVRILNTDLARQSTPSIDELIGSYTEQLDTATDADRLRFLSRVTGKDLLKCFRWYLIVEHGIYEATIADIRDHLRRLYPWNAQLVDRLYELYEQPSTDTRTIRNVLDLAARAKDSFSKGDARP